MARQPIFDKRLHVFAYELLFRGGPQNFFQPHPNAASSVIADSITLFDLQMLTGKARAFINVDELALRLGAPRLLPADRIVVEILESVKPSDEIVAICRDLRASGYLLALDDFVDAPGLGPLVDLMDYLKVDFQLLNTSERERVAKKYARNGMSLLAEKVETQQDLDEARSLGYSYFQGYFFCKPSMLETRQIPVNKLVQLRLLSAVSAPELNYNVVEELMKQDPSLLYRLLRYLNSPALGLRSEVHGVRQALTLLGEQEFRRWMSVFAMIAMSSGKPPELIRTALTRAYFCEEFAGAAHLPGERPRVFLMGLLSVTDALLDKPIKTVMDSLPVAQEVKTALCGGANPLRDVYDVVLRWERGDWQSLAEVIGRIGCDEEEVGKAYRVGLQKAAEIGV